MVLCGLAQLVENEMIRNITWFIGSVFYGIGFILAEIGLALMNDHASKDDGKRVPRPHD
jgi:hypothetical protein